jgi:predicted permease
LVAGAGYLLGKWLQLNPRTLSQVIFYVFSPCLIFNLITHSQLDNNDILRIFAFALSVILIIGALAWVLGRVLQLDRHMLAAVILTCMFMNAGNYGLPLVNFAFGPEALVYASLMFVAMNFLLNTIGVLIASLGTSNLKKSLLNLIKTPVFYAVLLGIFFLSMGWQLPGPVDRTVKILGDASIPCMLLFMGLQFHSIQWKCQKLPMVLVSGIRLVVAPLLALAFSSVFRLEGSALQAGVIESGMPSAVLTTVVATEFDIEPAFVTAVVFLTTILSPVTLSPLLYYLGA